MKYKVVLLVFLSALCSNVFGQEAHGILTGKVTFVTAKNIYVSFNGTKNIKVGDSLKLKGAATPCLVVTNKSSKSVVTKIINQCSIKKDDIIIFNYTLVKDKAVVAALKVKPVKTKPTKLVNKKDTNSKNTESVFGKIEVASYSNFYSTRASRHRFISRFTLDAQHINNSKFSFETYLNYRKETHSNYDNLSPLKIYDLAFTYDATPTLSIALGRAINNNTSSLGAMDGLQVEKHFGKNFVGAITGFRPDIKDYSFNSNLFQYGAYFGRKTNSSGINASTTFGFIEQQNNSKVDRRYAYFQNSSTFNNKLNLFSTVELDLFNKFNGLSGNSRLTNFYLSARYKFSRKFRAMVSFDSRKRIIYYETYQSQVEKLLSDDFARQGLRFRINTRPFKYTNVGLSYSRRFQSNGQNKSENINAYISMYRIPHFKGSLSLTYNRNVSNYLESNIVSLRHARTIFNDKWSTDFYIRYVNYSYTASTSNQYYFGTDLSVNLNHGFRFSLYGEYVKGSVDNNYRINTRLVKRFNNKKKKRHYAY